MVIVFVASGRSVGRLLLASIASFGGFAGISPSHPPIRSARPAWIRVSRTAKQFSGLKNCISARCSFRSFRFFAVRTGYFVNGSTPV